MAIKPVGVGRDPLKVVERAIHLRDKKKAEGVPFDAVWAVIDVDEHSGLSAALALAKAEGVKIVLSNPCFEVWLALHEKSHGAHLTSQAAGDLARSLGVCTGKHINEPQLMGKYEIARGNAQLLRNTHARAGRISPQNNPSTNADDLIEEMIATSKSPNDAIRRSL